jgi:hypothetical protein
MKERLEIRTLDGASLVGPCPRPDGSCSFYTYGKDGRFFQLDFTHAEGGVRFTRAVRRVVPGMPSGGEPVSPREGEPIIRAAIGLLQREGKIEASVAP